MSAEPVEVFCGRAGFSVNETEIAAVVRCLQKFAPWEFPAGTLSVAFLGDEEICKMHADFLADPSKTDVITFPGDEVFSAPRERRIPASDSRGNAGEFSDNAKSPADAELRESAEFAGEICICVDQALRAAKELGTTPADELLLYLVHGWLHLAGLDDIDESDRKAMRAAEKISLDLLREKELAPLKTPVFPQ